MKIWGIGLSKTGIVSLKEFLKGHGIHIIKYPDFKELHGDNDGGIDLPVAVQYKELDRGYPGSKFILTERNHDDWYHSITNWYLHRVIPDEPRFAMNRGWRKAAFGHENPNPVNTDFIDVYDTHVDTAIEYFENRPDDFLRINICDGDSTEALCEFLDLDKSVTKFPHLHKSSDGYETEELKL